MISRKNQITIFISASRITIFAVFHWLLLDQSKTGDLISMLIKLFKKGPAEIKITTVFQGIIVITPPHVVMKNGEGFIR